MSIKINSLEIEGVKRVKAVALSPAENGLTIIGGKNGQGKTSVLDAIAWALGGAKFKPSNPVREGSYSDPFLRVTLSDGIVVERKGKNSDLKVTDPSGKKAGQSLLDSFIEELALDLPKFMQSTSKEKAQTLLSIIGVGDKLAEFEREEQRLYNERYTIGRMAEQKDKYAAELPYYDGIPDTPVSAAELISRQQAILAANGENARKRENVRRLTDERDRLTEKLHELSTRLSEIENDLRIATLSAAELHDQSTAELEADIANIDALNIKIRSNLDRENAFEQASALKEEYKRLSGQIEEVRTNRLKLLENADLPLAELSVEEGELLYKGNRWDCLSGSEQLKVATAIIRRLKPECGFVLIDKLEQMDIDTLREFGAWLESEGLQAIATRVSTGDECSVIISDGTIEKSEPQAKPEVKAWTNGTF